MKKRITWSIGLVLLACAIGSQAQDKKADAKTEQDSLDGTWNLVQASVSGKEFPTPRIGWKRKPVRNSGRTTGRGCAARPFSLARAASLWRGHVRSIAPTESPPPESGLNAGTRGFHIRLSVAMPF